MASRGKTKIITEFISFFFWNPFVRSIAVIYFKRKARNSFNVRARFLWIAETGSFYKTVNIKPCKISIFVNRTDFCGKLGNIKFRILVKRNNVSILVLGIYNLKNSKNFTICLYPPIYFDGYRK